MDEKAITIQTNEAKKGKLDQRSFECTVYDFEHERYYALNVTRSDLLRRHFIITPGCRIIDEGTTYLIQDILYPTRPLYPYLVVDPNLKI